MLFLDQAAVAIGVVGLLLIAVFGVFFARVTAVVVGGDQPDAYPYPSSIRGFRTNKLPDLTENADSRAEDRKGRTLRRGRRLEKAARDLPEGPTRGGPRGAVRKVFSENGCPANPRRC